MKHLSSRIISFMAVFASLTVVLNFLPSVWRSWAIYLEPITGIVLGPYAGFFATLIGSTIATAIKPSPLWMINITGSSMGTLAAGLLSKENWRQLMAIYGTMLGIYFVHPLGTWFPVWAILETIMGFILIVPTVLLSKDLFKKSGKALTVSMILIFFVSTSCDTTTGIFLLVPLGLYSVLGSPEAAFAFIMAGVLNSYIEVVLIIVLSAVIGVPLFLTLRKYLSLRQPLS